MVGSLNVGLETGSRVASQGAYMVERHSALNAAHHSTSLFVPCPCPAISWTLISCSRYVLVLIHDAQAPIGAANQIPKLPVGSNKRRMPDLPTPEMLKKMKIDSSASSSFGVAESSSGNGTLSEQQRVPFATVEDVDEDMEDGQDADFAPGGDADYFAEEDQEGRFFGGGLSSEQKEILNIFDKDGGEGVREDVSAHATCGLTCGLPRVSWRK